MTVPAGTALLREPRFRRFWVAGTVSTVGDGVTSLALPLVAVSTLSASAVQVSVLTALVWAPNLLGVVIGAWVDGRRRPVRLMVAADLARGALLVTLPVAALFGAVTLPQLYVVVLATGIASVVFGTTGPRMFVQLLRPEQFVGANGLTFTSRAVVGMVAPAAGGVLAQAIGAPATIGVDVVSYLVSASLLRGLGPGPGPVLDEREPLRDRLWAGLRVLVHDPVLRACLGSATTVNLFGYFVAGGLSVLFARRDLGLSATAIGVSLSVGAIGGVLAAAAAPRVSARIGLGRTTIIGALLFPMSNLVVPVASGSPMTRAGVFGAAEFVAGVGVMLFDVPINAIQAAAIPDRLRSRVTGAFAAVNYGVRPIGALLGGAFAATVGLRLTFVIAGAGGLLSAVWLIRSPVRRVERLGPGCEASINC